MPYPKSKIHFGCHTNFKILLEVPQPDSIIFSLKLDQYETLSWQEVGGVASPLQPPRGAATACQEATKYK